MDMYYVNVCKIHKASRIHDENKNFEMQSQPYFGLL